MADDKPFDEFTGTILTAMFRQSEAASNAVTDALEGRVREMRESFARFFDAVQRANVAIDSARLERILWEWEYLRDSISSDSDVA